MTANRFRFRAWLKDRKVMVDVYLLNFSEGSLYFTLPLEDWIAEYAELDDVILMQSTGLTDKNGVEVFEGDIVSDGRTKGNVFWHDTYAQFLIDASVVDMLPNDDWSAYEVISNIYQNPEMVKP